MCFKSLVASLKRIMKTMSLCGKPRREERARKYLLSYASSAKNTDTKRGGKKTATGAKRGKKAHSETSAGKQETRAKRRKTAQPEPSA